MAVAHIIEVHHESLFQIIIFASHCRKQKIVNARDLQHYNLNKNHQMAFQKIKCEIVRAIFNLLAFVVSYRSKVFTYCAH